MNKAFILFLLSCVVAAMVSCGGNNSTLVIVSPTSVTLVTGGNQQFTANVPVTWTVTGDGVINSAGFFTAGGTTGAATITATAVDRISTNNATVTVVAPGSTTTTTTTTSGLKHRVFVSNGFPGTLNTGFLNVIDADKDLLSTSTISLGGTPGFMVQSPDKLGVVVFDTANNILRLVADSTEAVFSTIQLPGPTSSVLLAVKDLIGYTAVPTAQVFDLSGNVVTGAVYLLQFNVGTVPLTPVAVPGAKTISFASPNSDNTIANILAFSQNCDSVTALQASSQSTVLQFASIGLVASGTPCPSNDLSGTFSRPITALFSADGMTAYVLSSGPANGGTAGARVTQLDMTPTTCPSVPAVCAPGQTTPGLPVKVGSPVAVPGALVGLIQGTMLYVAGEDPANPGKGILSAIDISSNFGPATTVTSTPLVTGIPNVMECELVPTSAYPTGTCQAGAKIWIGSKGCTLTTTVKSGCLAVFTPGTPGSVIFNQVSSPLSNAVDDVTGMTWLKPLNGRNVMYVAEGGEVQIYISDTAPLAPVSPQPVDIVGNAVDVKSAF